MRLILVTLTLMPAAAGAWSISPNHWNVDAVSVSYDSAHASRTLRPEQVEHALDGALDAWSKLPEAKVMLALGVPRAGSDETSAQPKFNLVRFRKDWPHDAKMLAFTVLWVRPSTGEITGATIEVNEHDYRFSTDGANDHHAGDYDLQAVLTHELGHLLGLGHSEEEAATMYSGTRPRDISQRAPDADDRAGLAALYPVAPHADRGGATAPVAHDEPTKMPAPTVSTVAGCSAVPGRASSGGLLLCLLLALAFRLRASNG